MKRVAALGAVVLAWVLGASPAAASGHRTGPVTVSFRQAIAELPVAREHREGYHRGQFKHWLDDDRDGCSTRAEVLLEEAVAAPAAGPGCVLTGGRWYSAYDNVTVDGPRGLDVDHSVPLAESWDSGAHTWTAGRRAAYANDLDDPRSLIAVTARSNRSKADQDPTTWTPPHEPYLCTYLVNWVAVKTRWSLTVDETEKTVLREHAHRCPEVTLTVVVVD